MRTLKLIGEEAQIAFHYLSWVEGNIEWEDEDWDQLTEEGYSPNHQTSPVREAYAATALEVWGAEAIQPDQVTKIQRVVRVMTRDKIIVNHQIGRHYFVVPGPNWFVWINWILKNEEVFRAGNETAQQRRERLEDEQPIQIRKAIVTTAGDPIPMPDWKRLMKQFREGRVYFIVCDSKMRIPSKAITWDKHLAMQSVMGADDE